MKLLFVVLLCVSLAYGQFEDIDSFINDIKDTKGTDGLLDININKQVDKYIEILRKWLPENGYDPLSLPDVHGRIEFKPLWITYHADLKLKNGWVQNLRSINRSGDAFVSPKLTKLTFKIPLHFPILDFAYDWSATFMGLGPKGGIIGTLKRMSVFAQVTVDIRRKWIELKSFEITSAGRIDIKFTGNPMTDFWANAFMKAVTIFTHEAIVEGIQGAVAGLINDKFDQINKHFHPELTSTTAQPNRNFFYLKKL